MTVALPAWISRAQVVALERLVALLERERVPYQVTGGLAGNLHGSSWPVHDMDVDVPSAALARIAERVCALPDVTPGSIAGPAPYRDEEFDLDLLEFTMHGVDFDLSGDLEAFVITPAGARHPLEIELERAVVRSLGALALRVIPLEDLIWYKRLIGRIKDVADLERLR